jgi:hypothetical protein
MMNLFSTLRVIENTAIFKLHGKMYRDNHFGEVQAILPQNSADRYFTAQDQ